MPDHRRRRLLSRIVRPRACVAMLAAAVTIGAAAKVGRRGPVERGGGVGAGVAFADGLEQRTSAANDQRAVRFADAIALGYLERARLGLGSPFRLAEYALRDPRLDSTTRRDVAWAIVGRTLAGAGYAIDPA